MATFKPMLACSESCHHYFDKLTFPLLASPKIDGVRGTVLGGVVKARSGDPLKNQRLQEAFKGFEFFDGEFAVGDPTRHDLCRATTSVVNAKDKPIDEVKFYVFDHVERPSDQYRLRQRGIYEHVPFVERVEQIIVANLDGLLEVEENFLDQGYEGLIVRDPHSPYKFGRSTAKEQKLLKLKRFVDGEFLIVGFYERMHNANEATIDALGHTKRSSHKENKHGRGDLGGLVLKWDDNTTFRCGTGFDDALRAEIWANQSKYLGKLAKVKYFAKGMKDLPRHPTFLSFREKWDM